MVADLHLGSATGDPDLEFPAAPPDGFTGRFQVTGDMLFFRYSVFRWSLATTLDSAFDLGGGYFDFVGGRLVDFSLYYVGDPDGHQLSMAGFAEDLGYASNAYWGGTWRVAVNSTGAVPEPGTWALMLAGFGASGAALRRRTRPALG